VMEMSSVLSRGGEWPEFEDEGIGCAGLRSEGSISVM